MRIGVLASGGDSPGMNAAIRGAVLRAEVFGLEMIGFTDGWRGFLDGEYIQLDRKAVRGISPTGGVIIGTSRVNPFSSITGEPEDYEMIKRLIQDYGIDGFMLIGGDGTHKVSGMLQRNGIPVVGLPKTIDNDIAGTDYTFGFDTAVQVATDAIDRLRTTGESHKRCMLLEVMGRNAGWIALHAGIAGGAHVILIPERAETLDQIVAWVKHVHERGRSALVIVAEGFKLKGDDQVTQESLDGFGRERLGGIADVLAPLIEENTGIVTRATVLGHLQRGGSPSAFDRVLATRTGMAATTACYENNWGQLVVARGNEISLAPISEIAGKAKTVPQSRYEEVRVSFG
ncbi:MAG TPA: ATP-dependent 6-phosphofructokinase [Microbacteriaceae bacterium]|nr:ATP-dependent 6-phosphofructokinase [Microbacteriaceae bacterium]